MKERKKLLVVMVLCLIGSFVMTISDSSAAIRDETNIIIYETGIRNDLQFRLVNDEYTKKAKDWIVENYQNKEIPDDFKGQTQLLLQISSDIRLPHEFELMFRFARDKKTDELYPREILSVERKITLGGNDVIEVWLDLDTFNSPVIDFQMSSRGAIEFKKLTGMENKGKRLAIIISNKIRTAPTIEEQIVGGAGSIFGDFSTDEAKEFVQMFMNSSAPIRID